MWGTKTVAKVKLGPKFCNVRVYNFSTSIRDQSKRTTRIRMPSSNESEDSGWAIIFNKNDNHKGTTQGVNYILQIVFAIRWWGKRIFSVNGVALIETRSCFCKSLYWSSLLLQTWMIVGWTISTIIDDFWEALNWECFIEELDGWACRLFRRVRRLVCFRKICVNCFKWLRLTSFVKLSFHWFLGKLYWRDEITLYVGFGIGKNWVKFLIRRKQFVEQGPFSDN